MKSFIPLLVIVLLLPQAVCEDLGEVLFEALSSGNYSVLRPHLDPAMEKAFDERSFNSFRDKLAVYGELKGYRFERQGSAGGYTLRYYVFEFEKAEVILRLVVDSEGRLSGIWIDAIKSNAPKSSLFLAFLLPALGGIAVLLLFRLAGFKLLWAELLLGAFLVLVTLFVQPFFQQLPLIALGIKSNADVIERGSLFVLAVSLWLGTVAGLFQEALKYFFVRTKTLKEALFVGLGFGVGEAVIIPAIGIVNAAIMSLPAGVSYLSFVERALATLFHAGTGLTLAYFYRKGRGFHALIVLSALHGLIDTFAAHYQLTASSSDLWISYALLAVVSLLLLRPLGEAKSEVEERKVVW